jgi:hypothetical protein
MFIIESPRVGRTQLLHGFGQICTIGPQQNMVMVVHQYIGEYVGFKEPLCIITKGGLSGIGSDGGQMSVKDVTPFSYIVGWKIKGRASIVVIILMSSRVSLMDYFKNQFSY